LQGYTSNQKYNYSLPLFVLTYVILTGNYVDTDSSYINSTSVYELIDNYYEASCNGINNDLFGFFISYYLVNGFEFTLVGFLLLVGSVVCVNLYAMNKDIRAQTYTNYLSIFKFFVDFVNFTFLKRQNLTKQGNSKASLGVFLKN
jgi:hypothetical protein